MSNYTKGFQKMVDFALRQSVEAIEESIHALSRKEEMTRAENMSRSALFVAYEKKMGEEATDALLESLGI